MVRAPLVSLLAVAVMCGGMCTATAQHAPDSTKDAGIELQVLDVSGAVVPGAEVSLLNEATKEEFTGKADGRREFRSGTLPPGSYLVQVRCQGFRTFKKQTDVSPAGILKLRAELVVRGGSRIEVEPPTRLNFAEAQLRPQFPVFELRHRTPPVWQGPEPPKSKR